MNTFQDPKKKPDDQELDSNPAQELNLAPAIKRLKSLNTTEDPNSPIRNNITTLVSKLASIRDIISEDKDFRVAVLTVEHLETALRSGALMPVNTDYADKHYPVESDLVDFIVIRTDKDQAGPYSRARMVKMAELTASNKARRDGIISALRLPSSSYAVQCAVEDILYENEIAQDPALAETESIVAPLLQEINIIASALDLPDSSDSQSERSRAELNPVGYLVNERGRNKEWLKKAVEATQSRAGILLVYLPEAIEEYSPAHDQTLFTATRIVPEGVPFDKLVMVIPMGEVERSILEELSGKAIP